MRLLLDTHGLIWWWLEDPKLPEPIRDLLADRRNDVLVSAAAGWEIAVKVGRDRLPAMAPYIGSYQDLVVMAGFAHLPILPEHGVRAGLLPGAHRDPFDRIVAAQALVENLTVVTRDAEIRGFGCKVIW